MNLNPEVHETQSSYTLEHTRIFAKLSIAEQFNKMIGAEKASAFGECLLFAKDVPNEAH